MADVCQLLVATGHGIPQTPRHVPSPRATALLPIPSPPMPRGLRGTLLTKGSRDPERHSAVAQEPYVVPGIDPLSSSLVPAALTLHAGLSHRWVSVSSAWSTCTTSCQTWKTGPQASRPLFARVTLCVEAKTQRNCGACICCILAELPMKDEAPVPSPRYLADTGARKPVLQAGRRPQ